MAFKILFFPVLWRLLDIGEPQDIVHGSVILECKFYKYLGGDIVFTGLIFGIPCLGHIKYLRQLFLGQIPILPKATDPFIHVYHLAIEK